MSGYIREVTNFLNQDFLQQFDQIAQTTNACNSPAINSAETIIGKNERNACFSSRITIAFGVAYIYRRFKLMIIYNIFNILSFRPTFSAIALVPRKIFRNRAVTQESLDIAALAIAYDI